MSRKQKGEEKTEVGANAAPERKLRERKAPADGSRILAIRQSTGLQLPFDVRYPSTTQVTFLPSRTTKEAGMHRIIATSFAALAFVAAVQSDDVLKCYICTSLSDKGCGSELDTSLVEPVECTLIEMDNLRAKMEQHKDLNIIKRYFEVSVPLRQHKGTISDMECSKMTLNLTDQDVIVRTCQAAKTESVDPCKTMEKHLENQHVKMNKCDLCSTHACNSTTIMRPGLLYILLSFLGSLIHVAFYRLA